MTRGMCRLLLLLVAAGGARSQMEMRWVSLGGGVEAARHADDEAFMFKDAAGWTRSLFGSTGCGRWMVAAGVADQRIWQDAWSYRGIKRVLWGTAHPTPALRLEAMGATVSSRLSWPPPSPVVTDARAGWIAGGGLGWCPDPAAAAPVEVGVRLMRIRPALPPDSMGRQLAGEMNLGRRTTRGTQRLGLLLNRAGGHVGTAGLARATGTLGTLDLHASLLVGHQRHWLDVERLVIHDAERELRAAAAAGIELPLAGGWRLSATAGWERLQGHESRWLFLGGRWTRQVWTAGR